jgi:hypothetical protein
MKKKKMKRKKKNHAPGTIVGDPGGVAESLEGQEARDPVFFGPRAAGLLREHQGPHNNTAGVAPAAGIKIIKKKKKNLTQLHRIAAPNGKTTQTLKKLHDKTHTHTHTHTHN